MTTCPKGHASASTDYCDECGTPINAAPAPAPSTTDTGTAEAPAPAQPCPDCGTPRTDRFCEVCGYDHLAVPQTAPATPSTPATAEASGQAEAEQAATEQAAAGQTAAEQAATRQAAAGQPATEQAATEQAAAGQTAAEQAATEQAATEQAATGQAAAGLAVSWQVVATADRAYYDRMRAVAGPDAPQVPFPAYCPQRRFALAGAEVLIGRRSRSRGIEPGIDLSGPPEDAAVSHAHALLVATPDGWSVVDLDSANGTYLNDATDQLDANVAVPLQPGDQVHIGGWTTLTIVA